MSYDNEHLMPPPDWNRVLVDRPKLKPLGDPTLWGNSITTLIDDDPALGTTGRVIASEQILLAQAADTFSRSWALSGTLAVQQQGWVSLPGTPPDGIFELPSQGMNVYLSVVQGIGKISLEHRINLACNGPADNIGLCWNQSSINGGPYAPVLAPRPLSLESFYIFPFAAIGALIGGSLSVRALYARADPALTPGIVIRRATMTCLLTPYAPGAGL